MPSPAAIRPLGVADAPRLAEWLGASEPWRTLGYTRDEWPAYLGALASDGREADVVEVDGAVAGLSVVRRGVLLGEYLELLAIAPWARRQGLGRRLLSHVEQRAFARARNFYLCVSDFNDDARAFYRAAGYEEVGAMSNLIVEGRSEILMRKSTGPARAGR